MKTLYYYEDYMISDDYEKVQDELISHLDFYTDDGLVTIQENNIFSIDTFDELVEWANEYDISLKDLYLEYGIDIKEIVKW